MRALRGKASWLKGEILGGEESSIKGPKRIHLVGDFNRRIKKSEGRTPKSTDGGGEPCAAFWGGGEFESRHVRTVLYSSQSESL